MQLINLIRGENKICPDLDKFTATEQRMYGFIFEIDSAHTGHIERLLELLPDLRPPACKLWWKVIAESDRLNEAFNLGNGIVAVDYRVNHAERNVAP